MQFTPSFRRLAFQGRIIAGAPALVLALAVPLAAQTLETGPIKVTDSGSITPNGYALKGVTGTANNAGLFGYGTVGSSAVNIDGVVGYVQTPQSVGVVGWAQSTGTSAYGVYGSSASGPGIYGYSATGYGGAASIYGYNDGPGGTAISAYATQGTALSGSSVTGNGVYGATTASDTNWAAILGLDNSTISGNYAVAGQTMHGSGLAGFDYGSTGQAVYAYSNDGAEAVYAATYGGANWGTFSYNDSGSVSGWFEAGRTASNGLIAISDFSNAGLTAGESSGIGAEVYGSSGSANAPALAAEEEIEGTYPFAAYNFSVSHPGPGPNNETFILSDTANYSTEAATNGSDVNVSGDLYISGEVYSDCSAFPATAGSDCNYNPQVRTTSSGTKLRSYSNSQSLPTMEDFGEAQLVNGQAQVAFEHAFASTIDRGHSYLVFVTPEGDCHGLYVASKTSNGFVVRELMSGHSTVAFEYRIVAHPYGDASQRLLPLTGKVARSGTRLALVRGFNPRMTGFQQLLERSLTQRAAAAKQGLRIPRATTHPPLPLVKPALFTR
jgi:hypothetical protein